MPPPEQAKSHSFQAPKGTRDFYPADMARRRYIEKAWRDVSVRHGFEEIDGPTFEHLDLYTVKSGEGIVSELFSFRREGGEKDYALRPEFTPTLARMYAAKAGSLPKPTKWFWQQNCFRAEKPQRGRLREFGQWNVDFIGGEDEVAGDVEVIACCVELLKSLGLTPDDVVVAFSNRRYIDDVLTTTFGLSGESLPTMHALMDARTKIEPAEFDRRAVTLGIRKDRLDLFSSFFEVHSTQETTRRWITEAPMISVFRSGLETAGVDAWCAFRPGIVRGLAYYTGMVFEVHERSGAERAIAGGGRYDRLIELFGGPPTPAVGFGMGDVVLSLVLQDRKKMPEGAALLDKLAEKPASPRPDVFIISNGTPEADAALRPTVAALRRSGLHARHTYKATKNIGKLLQEASSAHARHAAIIEDATEATLKNLGAGTQERIPLADLAARLR